MFADNQHGRFSAIREKRRQSDEHVRSGAMTNRDTSSDTKKETYGDDKSDECARLGGEQTETRERRAAT